MSFVKKGAVVSVLKLYREFSFSPLFQNRELFRHLIIGASRHIYKLHS